MALSSYAKVGSSTLPWDSFLQYWQYPKAFEGVSWTKDKSVL